MSRTIAIAGMGWLGIPLAQRLKMLGFIVKGSVTQSRKAKILQNNGFQMYTITITEAGVRGEVQDFLKGVTDLVVMIPPGLRRNTGSDYVLKMTHFLGEIEKSQVANCIFISSTSVYGDEQGRVTEKDLPQPENEAGRQLFQVEQLFFTSSFNTSIVRFGGLFGGSRQPVRYLAGRENLSGGNAPVNLIHRKDCVQIISEIIQQQAFGYIFNAVNPKHPSKAKYYTRKSQELGLESPRFSDPKETENFKQVDSVNLDSILGFSFVNPL
ncbi:MAG: SDR family NAD(P)-dependent oxidoreductase [Flavobacteriaceae bacterium]|nr:SDR family NAD(P)-dependent oxidoreductase [Flavobacteriaceae bacterium]